MNNKIHKQIHYINDDTNGTFSSHTKTPKSIKLFIEHQNHLSPDPLTTPTHSLTFPPRIALILQSSETSVTLSHIDKQPQKLYGSTTSHKTILFNNTIAMYVY